MSLKNWKNVERQHNALLGCQGRTGPTGRDLPDSYSDVLAVESKCTATPPRRVQEWLAQSVENAERLYQDEMRRGVVERSRLPIVVVHEDGKPYWEDMVVMRLDDFVARVLPRLEVK